MNAFVAFDVSNRLAEVKNSLKVMGYWESWSAGGVIYNLPQNTLWKPDCELLQAANEIKIVISNLNLQNPQIILQRCIVLSINPWEGITGLPLVE